MHLRAGPLSAQPTIKYTYKLRCFQVKMSNQCIHQNKDIYQLDKCISSKYWLPRLCVLSFWKIDANILICEWSIESGSVSGDIELFQSFLCNIITDLICLYFLIYDQYVYAYVEGRMFFLLSTEFEYTFGWFLSLWKCTKSRSSALCFNIFNASSCRPWSISDRTSFDRLISSSTIFWSSSSFTNSDALLLSFVNGTMLLMDSQKVTIIHNSQLNV